MYREDLTEDELIGFITRVKKALPDIPVGYVGVVDNDIRVCTHPDFQGKGLGKFMIDEAMKIWPNAEAKVKKNNKITRARW